MKSKGKIIFGILLITILISIYIGYNIYASKAVSYASDERTDDVQISNAKKVDIESIIIKNQKVITYLIIFFNSAFSTIAT